MDPCTVESGFLRKKPCGHASVTHCDNCERRLCAQHAVALPTDGGKKSGKFLCKECQAAWKDIEKNTPAAPPAKLTAPPKPAPAATKPEEPKPAGSGGLDFK